MKRSVISALIFATAHGALSAAAQESRSLQLEEVVVTATRRTEVAQSVPTSIVAVSGAELGKRGFTSFQDLAQTVSGIDLQQPEGLVSAAMYVRGVGTASTSTAETSVGVLVDGVYQLRPGAAFTEMLDVERVEVLRGPQGTLFGRNTTAGVIRVETAQPDTDAFSGRLQGVVGNLDDRELRGVLNLPLIDGVLAARISGYTARRDGYTENLFLAEDTRNLDREGGRVKLLWQPSDNLRFLASAEKLKQSSRMDQSLVAYPDQLLDQYGDILPPLKIGKYWQNRSRVWDDLERYSLTVDWELPNHTLTSITAYEEVEGFILTDRDLTILGPELGPRALTAIDNLGTTKSTTQEIQLSSDWEGKLNYIAGLYWQNEELVSTSRLYFGGGTVPLDRPPTLRDVDSKAVFGNVSYDFSDRWSGTLGARYTEDEKQGQNNVFNGVTTFREWTYSLKLSHHLDDARMIYVSHDKGFKSGGVNRELDFCGAAPEALCLTPDQALWDPEITYNYEIGFKSEWLNRRLRLNGAVFYQTYDDFQVTQTTPDGSSVLITNAAEVNSRGLEVEFVALVSEHLTLSGNATWLRNKYEEYENAPCPDLDAPSCIGGRQDLSGKTLDNAPRLSYSLSGEYRRDLSRFQGVEGFSRLDVVYRGSTNLDVLLPRQTRQGGYQLVNASLGFEVPDQWRVTLWGRNLADKEYKSWAEMSETLGLRITPGLPRTYGLTVDWYF